jgi:hypothetical protein
MGEIGALSIRMMKSSTSRYFHSTDFHRLEFLHLALGSFVDNFFNAFRASTLPKILASIFQHAPHLVGLRIPLPNAPRSGPQTISFDGISIPKSLAYLQLVSFSSELHVDLYSVQRFHFFHLCFVDVLVLAHTTRARESEEEEIYEDEMERWRPRGPRLYIGGSCMHDTLRIFREMVKFRA